MCNLRLSQCRTISRPGSDRFRISREEGPRMEWRGELPISSFLIGADDEVAFADLLTGNAQGGRGV
jgi:hypothetical protein